MNGSRMGGTHIGIVSDSPFENLLPFLQFRAERILLLISSNMQTKAEDLKQILIRQDWQPEVILINDMPANNLGEITDFAFTLLSQYESNQSLYFNCTSGSNGMVIGMLEACNVSKVKTYFYDLDGQQIYWTHESPSTHEKITSELKLEDAIEAYGKTVKYKTAINEKNHSTQLSFDSPEKRKRSTYFLSENAPLIMPYLQKLKNDSYQLINQNMWAYYNKNPSMSEALSLFIEDNIIENHKIEGCYQLTEHGKEYVNGLWLREFTTLTAEEMGIDHIYTDINIGKNSEDGDLMDCLLIHNNRMLFIECNTDSHLKKVKDYKLPSLIRFVSQLKGKALFLSLFTMDDSSSNQEMILGSHSDNTIKNILAIKNMTDLKSYMKTWMLD